MRVHLLTLGSRGDVEPFLALADGLRRAGHAVRLATAEPFAAMAEARGVDFFPLDGEFLTLQETAGGMDTRLPMRELLRRARPMFRRMLDDAWRAAQGADLLVAHPKVLGAVDLADALDVPVALALFAPLMVPTRQFPSAAVPPGWPRVLNRLSYRLVAMAGAPFADVLNAWRAETLGLGRVSAFRDPLVRADGRRVPVLHAYSPAVVPRPDDWPDSAVVTGYWRSPAAPWAPPDALVRFLTEGPPPLYVGFGSMTSRDAAEKGRLVLEALRRSGQRGVLQAGWGGLAVEGAADVLVLGDAPHDALFPHMAGVVHHGGAGTTAAGLAAGRPTLVCPFFGDQPFWGARIEALGVGPAPVPQKRLTAERLAAGMRAVATDAGMRDRAGRLATVLAGEDGVAAAVAHLERLGAVT